MLFSLNAACKSVTDAPLRIRSLQVLKIADKTVLAEIGLAFRYNPAAGNFGIFALKLRPDGKSYAHTQVAVCSVDEKVTFSLISDKKIRQAICELRKADGTTRRFSTTYSLGASHVTLAVQQAEKHPSGAQAKVEKEKVVLQNTPLPTVKPDKKPTTTQAAKK